MLPDPQTLNDDSFLLDDIPQDDVLVTPPPIHLIPPFDNFQLDAPASSVVQETPPPDQGVAQLPTNTPEPLLFFETTQESGMPISALLQATTTAEPEFQPPVTQRRRIE